MAVTDKRERLRRRHLRIRKKLWGTTERPRLCVHRTNRHMVASLVDDSSGRTIMCVTTTAQAFATEDRETKSEAAGRLGLLVADKARELGITSVVFDRGGHPYHGRVKALAEKAREGGLQF
jgi:large subunit ribosomal protein L18